MQHATAIAKPTTSQAHGMAALAYVLTWITGLVVLLTAHKDDKYTRYHAIQAIGLGVVLFAVYLVWQFIFLGLVFTTISASAYSLLGLVSVAIWLGGLVAIVFCAVKAYQGSTFELPIIGPIAERNA